MGNYHSSTFQSYQFKARKGQSLSLRKAKQGWLPSRAEACHSSQGPAGSCHMTSLLLSGNEVTQMAWPGGGQEDRCCSSLQPLPHSLLGPLHVPSPGCFSCGVHTPVTLGVLSLVFSWACSCLHIFRSLATSPRSSVLLTLPQPKARAHTPSAPPCRPPPLSFSIRYQRHNGGSP